MTFNLTKTGDFIRSNKLIIALLFFRGLLDLIYLIYLGPFYGYAGFVIEINYLKYILSYVTLIIVFNLVPFENEKISEVIIQFFFVTVYLPLTSYFALAGGSLSWFIIFTIFWCIIFMINRLDLNWKLLTPKTNYSELKVKGTVVIFVVLVFSLIFSLVDLKFNFSLLDVYELRKENPVGAIPLSGYIVNWTGKIFLPFLLIVSIVKFKRYINWFSIAMIALIVLLFTITGHKSYLFMIPAIYGTIWLLRMKNFFFGLIMVFIVISVVGLLLFFLIDNTLVLSLFVRRTLFMPAQISFYYYDFFNGNPIYLSNSILKSFFEYPYALEPPYLISKHYFNKPEMSSNNGIVADGFAHFGLLGAVIWSILFALLLKILDILTFGKNKLIFWTLILLGARVFSGGSLLTGLLSHGFLVIILIAYFYPSQKKTVQ